MAAPRTSGITRMVAGDFGWDDATLLSVILEYLDEPGSIPDAGRYLAFLADRGAQAGTSPEA